MSNPAHQATESFDAFDGFTDGPFDVPTALRIGASNAQHNDAYNEGRDDSPPG